MCGLAHPGVAADHQGTALTSPDAVDEPVEGGAFGVPVGEFGGVGADPRTAAARREAHAASLVFRPVCLKMSVSPDDVAGEGPRFASSPSVALQSPLSRRSVAVQ